VTGKAAPFFWLTAYLWTTPCGLATRDRPHRPPRPAWRRTRSHLPARPFASIKTHSSPAAFPTTLSLPFVPHSSASCTAPPGRASGRIELHLLPATPPSSQQHRYDPASGNNAAARPAGSYSLDASAAPPRPSDPCVDPCTMTLVKRPAYQRVAGDLVTRRP
jgi:hypothetical protein